MNWLEVCIVTSTQGVDLLGEKLLELGVTGLVIEDAQDFQEFLSSSCYKWDYIDEELREHMTTCETTVKLYLPDNQQGKETMAAIDSLLEELKAGDPESTMGRLAMQFRPVRDEDWENNWKQYFKPFPVGERLVIKPSWEEYDALDGRILLEIDPGSSFGTGQHHTTYLCLEELQHLVKGGEKVLDMGCGSGILSIAALLLGADHAVGVDIEESAAKTALENAEKNGISPDRYTTIWGNVLSDPQLRDQLGQGQYDLITANIVADVIIAMAPLFQRYLTQNGTLLVSGIIADRGQEVEQALADSGFALVNRRERKDWLALTLKRAEEIHA